MSLATLVRDRDMKVFEHIARFGKQSLRKIAQATGLSKDSVSRSMKSISNREKTPGSCFWETEEGQIWLRQMVLAMLYEFGLKGNQGAERMSSFLKRIQVDKHVGSSPTALRQVRIIMEEELATYQREQEQEQREGMTSAKKIVAAGDETWLGEKMLLVLMDLSSGYLVMEEEAADRSHATWEEKSQARLEELGLEVTHFVSDRAKALIKLATSSFGSLAGADIFHAQYDLSKWLGRSLYGKKGSVVKDLNAAEEKKATLSQKGAEAQEIAEQEQEIEQCQARLRAIEAGKTAYDQAQQTVSATVHPFSVVDNSVQTSTQVEAGLQKQAHCFEQIAQSLSITDNKEVVDKFRRQIEDLSSIVSAWWRWTTESLAHYKLSPERQQWLLYVLLPVIYWYQQYHKTQNPDMKSVYQNAWIQAQASYASHAITKTMSKQEVEHWVSWAQWACGNFHRASSAVEGRNGVLSLAYRNGRALNNRRLAALTAIHNYDTPRADGTTPAQRLYGNKLPDLFEALLKRMGPLPLPRKRRSPKTRNPLPDLAVSP